MASSARVVDYLLAQMRPCGAVSAKKMFGEYGLFHGDKLVGVICDDRLFLKPTAAGRALLGACEEAPPYPGAKPSLVIDEERWADGAWLSQLVATTAAALPAPKPKRPKGGIGSKVDGR